MARQKIIFMRCPVYFIAISLLSLVSVASAQSLSSPDGYLMDRINREDVQQNGKNITELPNPGGPHLVGTVAYHWVDESRDEIVTTEDHDFRQVIVQIWYPALLTKDSAPAAYFPELGWLRAGLKTQKGNIFRKLEEDFKKYERVLTHSYPYADIDNMEKSILC